MSDGQNDITCLDILTKYIKLMDLQGYMALVCLLLREKKTFFEGKSYQTGSIVVSWNVHPTSERGWNKLVIVGGNFSGGSYPGWELSEWELSWVGIFQVEVILGGNFPRREFSGWELSGSNHLGGSFPSSLRAPMYFLKSNSCQL